MFHLIECQSIENTRKRSGVRSFRTKALSPGVTICVAVYWDMTGMGNPFSSFLLPRRVFKYEISTENFPFSGLMKTDTIVPMNISRRRRSSPASTVLITLKSLFVRSTEEIIYDSDELILRFFRRSENSAIISAVVGAASFPELQWNSVTLPPVHCNRYPLFSVCWLRAIDNCSEFAHRQPLDNVGVPSI